MKSPLSPITEVNIGHVCLETSKARKTIAPSPTELKEEQAVNASEVSARDETQTTNLPK